jgi:hypothetical protein
MAPEGYILTAVLRIRDIFVLTIQMRKTHESGSETLVYLYHSSKINSHKEVTKQYYIKVYILFLLDDGRIRFRIRTCD